MVVSWSSPFWLFQDEIREASPVMTHEPQEVHGAFSQKGSPARFSGASGDGSGDVLQVEKPLTGIINLTEPIVNICRTKG